MHKSSEPKLTRRLCAGLTKAGAMCESIVGGMPNKRKIATAAGVAAGMNRSGRPDRWICATQWAGWIEFKQESAALRDNQRIWMWQANRRRPGCALVARFFGDKIVICEIYACEQIGSVIEKMGRTFYLEGLLDDRQWSKDRCHEFLFGLAEVSSKSITWMN